MYLFKSIIISTISYLFYKLFLQKETFFQSIRWYFVVGMVISLLLPLFIIPIYVEVSPIIEPTLVEVATTQELPDYTGITIEREAVKPIDWQFWLQSIYLIGIAFFLLKFMMELFSLMRLISISKKYKKEHYYLVETNAEVSPFSFFNYIVYNKKDFKESELKNIIEHEKVHVNQKHSIDIILVQLFVILQWFNPFVWLYKKDLQQNLEYIADYFAQNKAETHKKYQYLLLKTSIKNNPFALSNNFFNSQLKKRIMMLQKSQTKKLNQLKYVLLLPLIALFMYSFNTKEIYIQKGINTLNYQNKTIVIDVSHGGNDVGASIDGYNEKELVLAISKKIAKTYQGNASIIFTRNNDEFVSLNDRVTQINTKKPDLVISLHINNSKDVRENGVVAYVSEKNDEFKQSKEVASLLLSNLTDTNLKNNGISKANLKISSDVNCPSVILELGYLSNKIDRAYLTSYNGQQEIAQKIIDFINGKQILAIKTNFILPIHNDNIISISGYGMRVHPITKKKELHKGIDFMAYNKMDVYAVASGRVINTGFDDEKGYFINIEHKNGFVTKYQHLGNVQIEKGDIVSPGEIIGIIGSTGKSVAPHLHFEVLKDGKNVNPKEYLVPFVKKEHDKKSQQQNVSNYKSLQHSLTYGSFFITKTIPTKEEILLWKNKDNFHIWIDDVSIDNKNISNYNNTDFSYYSVVVRGKVEGDFDVYLMSNKYFDNYIEKRDKEINPKTLKYIKIGASTTDEEFKSINNLNKKYGVKLMVEKIVRNSQDKIIDLEISIIDKDENVSGYMSDWQINKPIADFFIVYNKDRSIYKILSKRPVEYAKNNVMNNINVKTKNNKKQSGWIQYKKITYYYMLENNQLEFRNRYGESIEDKTANDLLIYFNNKYESNYKLKTNTKNFIHYKNEMVFYTIVNNQVVFYDKFGEQVDANLANELLNIYNKNKSNTSNLEQKKESEIIDVTKLIMIATPSNKEREMIIINGKKLTINEANLFKLNNVNTLKIERLSKTILKLVHIDDSIMTTTKKDKNGKEMQILITTSDENLTELIEKNKNNKMGFLIYTINNNQTIRGTYFEENGKIKLFDKEGNLLNKEKTTIIMTFLNSK